MQISVSGAEPGSYAASIFSRDAHSNAVIVADGHAVRITVRRGHLAIEDGLGSARRTRRIPRVPREVARIVILASDGFVTLDAVQWCAAQGIGIYQHDREGRCLISSPGQEGDTRVQRVQALADFYGPHGHVGLRIVNRLITVKMREQSDCVRDIFGDVKAVTGIGVHVSAMHNDQDHLVTMGHEGKASQYYWRAWRKRVFMPFSPDAMTRVPAHWLRFEKRANGHTIRGDHSPNRNATDPINAMLNYAYAVLESEAVHACNVQGLSPDLGFSHGDIYSRHGMALDLMECARPLADRAVLSMLDCGTGIPYENGRPAYIKPLWFCETNTGVCRLVAPLTHMITERVIPAVAPALAKHAEMCVRELAHITHSNIQPAKTNDRRMRTTPAKSVQQVLSPDLTAEDILPDHVWEAVKILIPPAPPSRLYNPNARADSRALVAGMVCHELFGIAWARIPPALGVDRNTCRRRFNEWKHVGAWDMMLAEIKRSA